MDDTVKALAKMIDHSLLHPTMTDEELRAACALARRYDVASVCIKPYAIPLAVEELEGSDVKVGAVIGFPHGNSSTEVKAFEADRACAAGAEEIDMVVNVGKALGGDLDFVREDIAAVLDVCREHLAILKVIFENDFLPDDKVKIRLCEICSDLGVDYVKTSSGYGMVKGPDGKYSYRGATDHDLKLMRAHCPPMVKIKAAGGVRTLDDLLRVRDLGVERVGATATAAMLDAARKRFAADV